MTDQVLIEKININKFSSKYKDLYKKLDHLCFLSKNLYNSTLYETRKHYFKTGEFLNYNAINKIFTHSNQKDYRKLPAKVSKQTQMMIERSYKSYFELLKTGSIKNPKPPKYLDSKFGRQIVHYEKGALSFKKQGYIKLSKTDILIPTRLTKDVVNFVRIVNKNNSINIEIGYKRSVENFIENNNFASIDIGLNNFATITSNSSKPLIINGKPLKSMNQYYNKQKSKLKSELYKNHKRTSSIKLDKLSLKRENKINDYLHKTTNCIMNYLVSGNIKTLIVGYNKGWKQNISIGKVNNQNFVSIPFYKFINQLEYKTKLLGIKLVLQEESYTSKCSFIDQESVEKQLHYSGKRIKRGLFISKNNILINSDINGSLNILKKYLEKKSLYNQQIYNELMELNINKPIKKISL